MTFFYPIIPMHEVVPKVVAIAVRMVMTKCMIFWMISFLFMALGVMSYEFFLPLLLVIQRSVATKNLGKR